MLTLQSLWRVADRLGATRGRDPDHVLDPCGLLLQRPLRRWTYQSSPRNALTFATTGGDGVHYGLLDLVTRSDDLKPIVMTVPMADRNIVLAETFEEFLGLGFHVGWFSLEQIVYNLGDTVDYFAQPDPESSPDREELLAVLRRELGYRHVRLSAARLNELRNSYWTLIEADDDRSQRH